MTKIEEAAAYLGMTAEDAANLRPDIIDAVTTDDLGTVPPELAEQPAWEHISDHDREEILRFRSFLKAARTPAITYHDETCTIYEDGSMDLDGEHFTPAQSAAMIGLPAMEAEWEGEPA